MKKCAQIHITGIVQGVGFRPYVYGLALRLGLNGWVRNTSSGVDITIEGEKENIDAFLELVYPEAPPLAHIDTIDTQFSDLNGFKSFEIIHSEDIIGAFQPISPDISICNDCLNELFNPKDRRYRYPFTNCTNCGPRFTIIKDIPYDRPLTTMAPFEMCSNCAEEYQDPLNRRFHAQPIACPECGPHIWLEVKSDLEIGSSLNFHLNYSKDDAIIKTQSLLAEGKIIAVKGLGGFHLACDATNIEAVKELRRRKLRVDKPFALMFADMDAIIEHCFVNEYEAQLLESRERPIVILQRRRSSPIASDVAPYQTTVGAMLPYTPLHYLIFAQPNSDQTTNESDTSPVGIPKVLVMTSGNLSEEPIAIENEEARKRLFGLSDAFLMHNRDIRTRCDDSVVRVFNGVTVNGDQKDTIYPMRRSRGYAPFPVHIHGNAASILAVGGELKNTFCITQGDYAFLSHHIGDMENYETLRSFEDGIKHYERLFRVTPEIIAYDLHPNYLSTRYALNRSKVDGIPAIATQHHHAHIAACMAEHNLADDEEVFGVAFDGTGYGEDGAIWGGEFLFANYRTFKRIAHLEYMPLPGGDAAIKNPAKTALAYLWKYNLDWDPSLDPVNALCEEERMVLKSQLENQINTPITSSMGRLFDAVSALIGVRQRVNYEAQAAIELEMLVDALEISSYPLEIDLTNHELPYPINIYPLIGSIIKDLQSSHPISIISARFHNTIALLVREVLLAMRKILGEHAVVLSGGVWQNITLLHRTLYLLNDANINVYVHRQVPPNDGGIALGQALIAKHRGYSI